MSRSKIFIKAYDSSYKEELNTLLVALSRELFCVGEVNLDEFIDNHWAIYLAIQNGEVIGFISFIINSYYGLRPPTIGNTYLFVKEEYRKTRATYLLSIQSGHVCTESNMPLEHYYASQESAKLSRKLNGTKMFEAYVYEVEEVNRVFKNLKKTIRN